MLKNILTRAHSRPLTRTHKIAVAGVGTLGAAAVAFSAVPASGQTATSEVAAPTAKVAYSTEQIKDVHAGVTDQLAGASQKVAAIEAKKQAAAEAAAKQKAATAAKKAAAQKAAQKREAQQAASRSAQRAEVKQVSVKSYPNNLDGWIRESLAIMKKHGIPGSYQGIHRNIMRESSGNPMAINNWDINARNGIPSKGLLQVIPPTFEAYHVPGTPKNIYDPVANITAACNYAADRYGSMDNVNSAY
ncbi:transglycosylase SLT domain-containing protein [Streptomyces sp. NPDC052309]|uniref:Transglycosylase SLT domain-containing protein n=1 Tax=Streptomyces griseicoloratus TaxID=2752516 RepID=A0A926L1U2_9ACTN|nr:transglycosylase SLT domain-containing protein [Streptomyces griseicoloratus]MBD0420977.1 transglycosylase SLT domain-containing protein [Streptomyces griseicoloratus]